MTLIQKLAIFYFFMFLGVFGMNYVPAFHDANGNMFGLFHLDLIDDMLHLGSALWALWAGLTSHKQALRYFQIFGPLYGMDGVVGLFTGRGYLDLGIFRYGFATDLDLMTRIFANIPHLVIGGGAVLIGYYLSKKVSVIKVKSSRK